MTEQTQQRAPIDVQIIAALETAGHALTMHAVWQSPEMSSVQGARGKRLNYMTVETAMRRMHAEGKLVKLPRYGNKAIEYDLPKRVQPESHSETQPRDRYGLAVLRVLYESGNYMSPETIGPKLVLADGETITVERITQLCNELLLSGWVRTVAGVYAIKPRDAEDHYGKPCFATSTVGGMLGPIIRDDVDVLVKECVAAIYPDGNGAQITAVTLPARIAQLRTDHEQMRVTLEKELTLRHSAERELAVLQVRYNDEVQHFEKLLEDERVAAAALAKRFEAVKTVLALLARES